MQNQPTAIKIGNYLYHHGFFLYRRLYPMVKRRQDAAEIELIKSSLSPGDVVLDIGANIGFYSRLLSRCVGAHGRVYAFEPDAENFGHLRAAVRALGNVEARQAAVGATEGRLTLFRSPLLNVDHRTYPIDDYTSKHEVACVAIDSFLPEGTPVRFIKMDIQGAEWAALQGMQRTLTDNRNHLRMLMELWPAGLKKAGASASAVVAFLERCGYRVALIEGRRQTPLASQQAAAFDDLEASRYFNVFVKKE
jgi:FkbM family methyltransferase